MLIATSETPAWNIEYTSGPASSFKKPALSHFRRACQVGQGVFLVLRPRPRHLGSCWGFTHRNCRLWLFGSASTKSVCQSPDPLVRLAPDSTNLRPLPSHSTTGTSASLPRTCLNVDRFVSARRQPAFATRLLPRYVVVTPPLSKFSLRYTCLQRQQPLAVTFKRSWKSGSSLGCVPKHRRAPDAGAYLLLPSSISWTRCQSWR